MAIRCHFKLQLGVPAASYRAFAVCHRVAKVWQRCGKGVALSGKAMETGTNPPPVVACSQGCLKIQALENAPCGSYVLEDF